MEGSTPRYPTDLSASEWEAVRPLLPAEKPVGADRRTSMRAVIDAILYRGRSGCAWRMLPHDFPHWRTVYGYHRQWQRDGTWERIARVLRQLRCESKRAEPPRAAVEAFDRSGRASLSS
jgi:transposase